ncbi:MAG: hypothetical protein ACR2PZ_13215 [Pseudomonadales bacterium]
MSAATLANEVDLSATPAFPGFADCDANTAPGIEGIWGVDVELTFKGHDSAQADHVAILTISGETTTLDIPNVGPIERRYRLIGGSDQNYTLELADDTGATETVLVQSNGCTLIYPSQQDCYSDYCENVRSEIYERIAQQLGGSITGAQIRERAESAEAIAKQQAAESPKQYYYRRAATN